MSTVLAWLVDSVEHHEREHVDHRAPVAGIVRPALEVLGPLRDALDRRVDLVKEPISEPSRLSAYFAASASASTAAAGVHSMRQATDDHPRFSRARSRARTSGQGIPGSSPDWYAAHRRSSAALKAATASGESLGCVGTKLAKSSSATAARSSSLRASASAITLAAADVAMKAGYRGRGVAGSARARCSTPPRGHR